MFYSFHSFKDLIFDEGPHKYYLYGEEMECVSNITHLFKPHFDEEKMAHDTYVRNYNKEGSKYYHMTPEMIIESWHNISKEACSRHNFGESVFWWMVGEYDKIVPEFKDRFKINENGERYVESIFPKEDAILSYWEDLPISYMPILAENKVFNKNKYYSYAGTFDIDPLPDYLQGIRNLKAYKYMIIKQIKTYIKISAEKLY